MTHADRFYRRAADELVEYADGLGNAESGNRGTLKPRGCTRRYP